MNSENSKTSDPHRLLPHVINMLFYQILEYSIHGKTFNA